MILLLEMGLRQVKVLKTPRCRPDRLFLKKNKLNCLIYIYIYIYIYIVIFSLYLFCYCFFILFKLLFKPKILGLFLAKKFYYIKNKFLEPRQSMNTMSDELYTEFLCNL